MKITTRQVDEFDVDTTTFESCSEAPKGCDRCCDRSGEDDDSNVRPEMPITSLKDLLLAD